MPKLYKKLKKMYLGKNFTKKLNLMRDLYCLKMEKGDNLIHHMNVFLGLVYQLKKVNVKIEEKKRSLITSYFTSTFFITT